MAQVQITDVVVPAEFTAYQVENSMVSTALFQSGVVLPNGEMQAQLQAGAQQFTVPFWSDIPDIRSLIRGYAFVLQHVSRFPRLRSLRYAEAPKDRDLDRVQHQPEDDSPGKFACDDRERQRRHGNAANGQCRNDQNVGHGGQYQPFRWPQTP